MKKYDELISVLIPVYNAEKTIDETITSVLDQSYKNVELICINDGSSDSSISKLRKYGNRLTIIETDNIGQSAASNLGIEASKGNFIKFLDADDILDKRHLELQLNRLKKNKNALASCKWGRFYTNSYRDAIFTPEPVWKDMASLDWLIASLEQANDMMPGWLWLIPRNILEKAGGWNNDLSLNNDFEFSTRLLLNADQVLFAEGAKLYYRSGVQTSLSSQMSEKAVRSALLSTKLGASYILKEKNDSYTRKLLANRYQRWIYRIYPFHREFRKEFSAGLKELGKADVAIEGSRFFITISSLIGWKAAKRLQLLNLRLKNSLKRSLPA